MKKILLLFIGLVLVPNIVYADTIKNIDMEVNLQKDGSAKIIETWKVKATEGTEWCKLISDAHELAISNFTVSMDNKQLEEVTWDPNADLEGNAGKFGIKYTNLGFELCFGKTNNKEHTFVLNYTLSDFIFNTDEGQAIYYTLLPKSSVEDFKVTIKSVEKLPSNLEIAGYGYNGYININDGIIEMTNDKELQNEYVVLLTKFKSDTFETDYENKDYKTIESINNDIKENHVVSAKIGEKEINYVKVIVPTIIIIIVIIAIVGYILVKKNKINLKKFNLHKKNK